MNVSKEVRAHAEDLKEHFVDLSNFEALQIAIKIVEIEAYKEANTTDRERGIPALEAIAICLGMDSQFSYTVTSALGDISGALNNVSNAIEKQLSTSVDNVATAIGDQE